jgi:O-antigen/teichoic acid export membrane protein
MQAKLPKPLCAFHSFILICDSFNMPEEGEELLVKIGKGTGWLFAGTLIAEIIAFFYRIVLARWLQPYEYGLFALVLMAIGFGTTFFTLGLPQALTKYIAEYRAKRIDTTKMLSTSVIFTALLGLASTLILFFLAEPLSYVLKNPDVRVPIQIGSFTLFFVLIGNLFYGALQGWQKMNYYAFGTITDKLTKFVLSLILLWLGFGLFGAVGALIFSFCVVAILLSLLYRKIGPICLSKFDWNIAKTLISFGTPVFVTSIAGIFLGWTDSLMIGYFMSEEWVGYYNAVLPILWILGLAISSLAAMLFPTFSELRASGSLYIEKVLNRSLKYAFYLLIPICAGGLILAEPIVKILFGQSYAPASAAFQVLIFGALFLGLRYITDSYLSGIGRPGIIAKIVMGAAGANVIMNWLFVQWWGIAGAGLSTSVSLGVIFLFSLYWIRKSVKLNFDYLPKSVVATVIMAVIVWAIKISTIMAIEKIVLIVVLGIAIYFGFLYILGGFDNTDKKMVKKIFAKF